MLGDLVKSHRESRGLSQQELARLAGVSGSFISRIEAGKYKFTSPDTIINIARSLKIKPEILLEATLPRNHAPIFYDPPRKLQDLTIREVLNKIVEVPVLESLYTPEKVISYAHCLRDETTPVNLVGLRVNGFTMEPAIQDGDILLIDKDAEPEKGKYVVCYKNKTDLPKIKQYSKATDLKNVNKYGVIFEIHRRV